MLVIALVTLYYHRSSLYCLDVRLVLDEVLHPCLIVSHQDGVVILQDLVSDLLVFGELEYFIYIDVVEDVVIFGEEDDQSDEHIDRYDEEDHDGEDYYE